MELEKSTNIFHSTRTISKFTTTPLDHLLEKIYKEFEGHRIAKRSYVSKFPYLGRAPPHGLLRVSKDCRPLAADSKSDTDLYLDWLTFKISWRVPEMAHPRLAESPENWK
jgi:hypothetical protein